MQETIAFRRWLPYPVQIGLLALVYFVAAKLSLVFAIPPGYASVLWPPAGIALAAMLLLGNRLWPGIWCGAVLANLGVGSSFIAAMWIGSGNTLEALTGAALIRHSMRDPRCFESGEEAVKFIACAALSAGIAATFALAPLTALHHLPWPELFRNWLTWWLGDVMGMIVVAPLILTWSASGSVVWSRQKKLEAGFFLLLLLLLITFAALSGGRGDAVPYPLLFTVSPVIILAAFRFGQREVTTATAVVCALATWYALDRRGLFGSLPEEAVSLVLLAFVSSVVVTGLVLSAVLRQRNLVVQTLRDGRDELDSTVRQRTLDLEQANLALRAELAAHQRADKLLQESEQRMRLILDTASDAFVGMDAKGVIVAWNAEAEHLFGWTREQAIGRLLADTIIPPRLREAHARGLQRFLATGAGPLLNKRTEIDALRRDGHVIPVELTLWPVLSDGEYLFNAFIRDDTERKRTEERLTHLAQFDGLTSLPNRHLLHDRLAVTLAQAQRSHAQVGCMFVDLDRFKDVNDTWGHSVGDKLLVQTAQRLQHCVRSGDTVGRLGGDEFAVVLSNLGHADDARVVAQKVVAALAAPFELDGRVTYVSASLGIAIYPNDGSTADDLLKNADTAMYRAKEQGRNNYQFYLPEMHERAMQRIQLEAGLHVALERREFMLRYLPRVDLTGGAINGVEALLYWRHPERGVLSPLEFLEVLEETGMIVPVGEWVVQSVCAQIRIWRALGVAPRPVAINLSARQFNHNNLAALIDAIKDSAIDPALFEFELTESLLMTNAEEVLGTLTRLKTLGVGLSVDDFGSGYSSLAYLKRFPLDLLKIDRTFIRDITINENDADITQAIISLAHGLKMKVVAEGVETAEQVDFLRDLKCNEIQGYYFAPPLDVEDCTRMLLDDRHLQQPGAGVTAIQAKQSRKS